MTDTVLALIHTGCGHACAVGAGDTFEAATRQQAKTMRLGPEWEFQNLDRDDATSRFAAGPCMTCHILKPARSGP